MTRRFFVLGLPALAFAAEAGKGRIAPSETKTFPDSATELPVSRLTSPEYTSRMPEPWLRSLSKRQNFMLYASDRSGSMQAWRMDLKTGESHQLTDAAALDPATLAMTPDERSFFFFDGSSLKRAYFLGSRETEIYRTPEQETRTGFALSEDGMHAAVSQQSGSEWHLQLINVINRATTPLAKQRTSISAPAFRPRRAQVLYRAENGLWLVDFTGQNRRRLKSVEGGELGPAHWSPNGKSILYLHFPGEHELNTIRELTPDENTDKLIAKTSQFAQFGINADASVFVGASRNPSSRYVLLMLRVTRRELTLCEHQASDATMVNPIFSPTSQQIYFQSDREGKTAIYRIRVAKFVEETDGE